MEPHPQEICGDCGVALPFRPGPTHPYLGASQSCWAMFGDVLAREYSDPLYMPAHRLTVDAYAAQHPGKPERRSIQSVWVHLASLYLTLERRLDHGFARRVIAAMTEDAHLLEWLDPPSHYRSTVADVIAAEDAEAHGKAVHRWAEDVWSAWAEHHEAVRSAAERTLTRL